MSYIHKKIDELSVQEIDELNMCLRDLICKISGIPVTVSFTLEEGVIIELFHRYNEGFHPTIDIIPPRDNTVLTLLNDLKNYRITKTKDTVCMSLAKILSGPNLYLTIDECSVCKEFTDFILGCEHHICFMCVSRVNKCPLCRAELESIL